MPSTVDEVTGNVHDLGPASRIPLGEGRAYRVEGVEIAVFRTRQGAVRAIQAECPHARGPLADGIVGNGVVVCPLHGFAFDLSSGAAVRDDCSGVRTYPARVDGRGHIVVTTSISQP